MPAKLRCEDSVADITRLLLSNGIGNLQLNDLMERAEEAQFETFWARLLLGICVIELEGKQELSGEKMNQGVKLM